MKLKSGKHYTNQSSELAMQVVSSDNKGFKALLYNKKSKAMLGRLDMYNESIADEWFEYHPFGKKPNEG